MSPTTSVSGSRLNATAETGTSSIVNTSHISLLDVHPWVVVVISCVLAILVAHHYDAMNGPAYWKWLWRDDETLAIAPMLGAMAPFVAAQWGFARGHWPRWSLLLLLMLMTSALATIAASAR